MEDIEYAGIWWLPECPENKVAGTLYYGPKEGGQLKLIGTLRKIETLPSAFGSKVFSPPIILGLSENGKLLTLYKCFEKSFGLSWPGYPKSTFFINIMFVGGHFGKEEELVFSDISINYSNLEEWIRIPEFKFCRENDQNKIIKNISFTYEPLKDIPIKLKNCDIKITSTLSSHSESRVILNLEQTIFINIKPTKPLTFIDYLNGIMHDVRNFLSLAMGRAVYPRAIIARSNAIATKLANGKVVLNDIQVFVRAGIFVDYSTKIDPSEMLFTYSDIENNIAIYLENWIDKSISLKSVYELFFGTFYNPSIYDNYKFLSFAQALETYHRHTFGGKYVSDDKYKAQYDAFIRAIDDNFGSDFKDSLHSKMRYLNEYSLKKRLKDLLARFRTFTANIKISPDSFIEAVCDTRNYLTHYDKQLESRARRGKDLYDITNKMKILLEMCFLYELGMSTESLDILVKRNQEFMAQ